MTLIVLKGNLIITWSWWSSACPFKDPDFLEKNAEFDTTFYYKTIQWVKKVGKAKIFFLSKLLNTGPSDTVLTSFFPYLKRDINFPNYWTNYGTN